MRNAALDTVLRVQCIAVAKHTVNDKALNGLLVVVSSSRTLFKEGHGCRQRLLRCLMQCGLVPVNCK